MNKDLFLSRGKRRNGKWIEGYYIPAGFYKGIVKNFINYTVYEKTVTRSIGRRDDNGKLIFAGDVLKIQWQDNENEFIIYEDYVCAGWEQNSSRAILFGCFTPDERRNELKLEIIGNVIDNPEFNVFRYYPGIHLDGIPIERNNSREALKEEI